MSNNTSRRSLVMRIAKAEKYLNGLPKPESRANKKRLTLWKRTLKEVRALANKLGGNRNVSIPLERLCISKGVIRSLTAHKVQSLETLGNIDTTSLRAALRGQHDRLISTVLIKLHPDSSGR